MTPYQYLMQGMWLSHNEILPQLEKMMEAGVLWEYEDYYFMTKQQIYFNSIHVKIL